MLSSFTHPHVVPNLYDLLSCVDTLKNVSVFCLYNEIQCGPMLLGHQFFFVFCRKKKHIQVWNNMREYFCLDYPLFWTENRKFAVTVQTEDVILQRADTLLSKKRETYKTIQCIWIFNTTILNIFPFQTGTGPYKSPIQRREYLT